jgi:hypothetical protein
MARLYDLTQQAKENNPEAVQAILYIFEPKIKKSSRFIPHVSRDDVEQEVKFEIVKALHRFDTSHTPGFWEFISGLRQNKSERGNKDE